jgi:PTH1 family peptidyl-tRNA hydrolase
MKLFVGLGNPDKKYQDTRHNIGHYFISILEKLNLPNLKTGINSGYMNEAGDSVQKLVHFYKISHNNFYLVHDDLDLATGEYRVQFDRGPAGHHGVESVIQHLGSQLFWRIRIGVGRPENKNVPIEDYVLQKFSTAEKILIDQAIDKIVSEIKKQGH